MRPIYLILLACLLVSIISLGMGCVMLASVCIIGLVASAVEAERIEATDG